MIVRGSRRPVADVAAALEIARVLRARGERQVWIARLPDAAVLPSERALHLGGI